MKLLIISPLGMTKFNEVSDLVSWGPKDNFVRSKKVIINRELAEKLFDYLPQKQAAEVVEEWTGVTVLASLVKEDDPSSKDLMEKMLIYISSEDRAERETRLFFPEYFV